MKFKIIATSFYRHEGDSNPLKLRSFLNSHESLDLIQKDFWVFKGTRREIRLDILRDELTVNYLPGFDRKSFEVDLAKFGYV